MRPAHPLGGEVDKKTAPTRFVGAQGWPSRVLPGGACWICEDKPSPWAYADATLVICRTAPPGNHKVWPQAGYVPRRKNLLRRKSGPSPQQTESSSAQPGPATGADDKQQARCTCGCCVQGQAVLSEKANQAERWGRRRRRWRQLRPPPFPPTTPTHPRCLFSSATGATASFEATTTALPCVEVPDIHLPESRGAVDRGYFCGRC